MTRNTSLFVEIILASIFLITNVQNMFEKSTIISSRSCLWYPVKQMVKDSLPGIPFKSFTGLYNTYKKINIKHKDQKHVQKLNKN